MHLVVLWNILSFHFYFFVCVLAVCTQQQEWWLSLKGFCESWFHYQTRETIIAFSDFQCFRKSAVSQAPSQTFIPLHVSFSKHNHYHYNFYCCLVTYRLMLWRSFFYNLFSSSVQKKENWNLHYSIEWREREWEGERKYIYKLQ